jgi:hypothetical protein
MAGLEEGDEDGQKSACLGSFSQPDGGTGLTRIGRINAD